MKTNKTNGMKRELLKFLGFSAVWMGTLAFSQMSLVHADEGSGHSGGGNITEADLRYYMGKMDTYLQSNDGKAAFPEIVAYDSTHPEETFKQLIQNTHPVVQKGELKDSNGVVRDCMSYANPGNRYFVCNSDALPNKTLENQPSFYRIVLHELMVQAGIEKPLSKDVPSVYEISSRITANVHLETYQEWVPGKGNESAQTLAQTGITCSNKQSEFEDESYAFIWQPNGDYALVQQHLPKAQRDYGIQQYQTITRAQERIINLKQSVAHFFGGDIITTVLARGNSSDILATQSDDGIQYKYRGITHDVKDEHFDVNTITELEKTQQFTRGSYSEFPLYLHLWDIKNIKKKDQYKVFNMICAGGIGDYNQWVPVKKIFEQKDQNVFKENLIEKYNNPVLRK